MSNIKPNDIKYKSDIYIVKNILKKTKARYFKDIKVNDKLIFIIKTEFFYSPTVTIVNLTQNTFWKNSAGQFRNNMNNFEFKTEILVDIKELQKSPYIKEIKRDI